LTNLEPAVLVETVDAVRHNVEPAKAVTDDSVALNGHPDKAAEDNEYRECNEPVHAMILLLS